MWLDYGDALRTLRRRPRPTGLLVATLGIGMALATVGSSIIDTALLHPISVPALNQVVWIGQRSGAGQELGVSLALANDWRGATTSFSSVAAFFVGHATLSEIDQPAQIPVARVSADFFRVLKTSLTLGREFLSSDDLVGAERVAIISNGMWRGRFGGKADVLERSLALNGTKYRIVGVMQPAVSFPSDASDGAWVPLTPEFAPILQARGIHVVHLIGRLRPGVSVTQSQSELARIQEGNPGEVKRVSPHYDEPDVELLRNHLTKEYRPALYALLWAMAAVLLVACVNAGSLLLAEFLRRNREMAMRLALGATRWRLVRQSLAEAAVLCVLAAAVGGSCAYAMVQLGTLLPRSSNPAMPEIKVRPGTLAAGIAVVVLAIVGLNLIGAWAATGRSATSGLREGDVQRSASHSLRQVRAAIITVEIAIACALLGFAGLLGRSVAHLLDVNPGFSPDNLITAQISRPMMFVTSPQMAAIKVFATRVRASLAAAPDVMSVAIAGVPRDAPDFAHEIRTERSSAGGAAIRVAFLQITPGYFRTLQIPLRKGRTFEPTDDVSVL